MVEEDITKLRKPEDYAEDVESLRNGTKGACVFNQIPSFNKYENFPPDFTHDIDEGAVDYDVIPPLRKAIECKKNFLTLEILNTRLRNFNFGPNSSNIPDLITIENLRKGKFQMTAAERKNFLYAFPFLIGDLVDLTTEEWQPALVLKQIRLKISKHSYNIGKQHHVVN